MLVNNNNLDGINYDELTLGQELQIKKLEKENEATPITIT
jgi:hypothetical protein